MSLLSPHHVQEAYRRAHQRCQMDSDVLPRAAARQELVTAIPTDLATGARVAGNCHLMSQLVPNDLIQDDQEANQHDDLKNEIFDAQEISLDSFKFIRC